MSEVVENTIPESTDGKFDGIPDELYHSDRGSLSVSGAKLLLPPSCPKRFRWEQDNPRAPKKVWDFGHVAHRLLLGKGAEIFVLDPAVHGLTTKGEVSKAPANTAMWQEASAAARLRGETPIHIDEFIKADDMAAEVLSNPDSAPLFAAGEAEQSLYWTDPATGVRLRGRTDWITEHDFGTGIPRVACVDYKTSTTSNPQLLQRKFWTLAYYMQAAWYIDLLIALGISENPVFLFVVQEKEPPFVVTVIEYDPPAIKEGRRANRQAIDTYLRCRDADHWPGYVEGIASLSLPPFVLAAGQPTIADYYAEEID